MTVLCPPLAAHVLPHSALQTMLQPPWTAPISSHLPDFFWPLYFCTRCTLSLESPSTLWATALMLSPPEAFPDNQGWVGGPSSVTPSFHCDVIAYLSAFTGFQSCLRLGAVSSSLWNPLSALPGSSRVLGKCLLNGWEEGVTGWLN